MDGKGSFKSFSENKFDKMAVNSRGTDTGHQPMTKGSMKDAMKRRAQKKSSSY